MTRWVISILLIMLPAVSASAAGSPESSPCQSDSLSGSVDNTQRLLSFLVDDGRLAELMGLMACSAAKYAESEAALQATVYTPGVEQSYRYPGFKQPLVTRRYEERKAGTLSEVRYPTCAGIVGLSRFSQRMTGSYFRVQSAVSRGDGVRKEGYLHRRGDKTIHLAILDFFYQEGEAYLKVGFEDRGADGFTPLQPPFVPPIVLFRRTGDHWQSVSMPEWPQFSSTLWISEAPTATGPAGRVFSKVESAVIRVVDQLLLAGCGPGNARCSETARSATR